MTAMPGRASMCCAGNLARTTCSVKNFELTTSCGLYGVLQALKTRQASNSSAKRSRFILGHTPPAFEQPQQKIGKQRQQSSGNGSGQNDCITDHRDSTKNKRAQAACANGGGNGGDSDGDYCRGANSR